MKFTVSSTELQKALSKTSGVVPSKSTLPILENLLLELEGDELKITATDLELSLSVTTKVKGIEDGKIAVPARRVVETVRALPETQVTLTADPSNKVTIVTETGEYRLTGESSEEFPSVPQIKGDEQITLPAEILRRMISKTVFAVSTDELRPAMMGVLFQMKKDELCAVSTDGHRLVKLSQRKSPLKNGEKDIVIPGKALSIIAKSSDESAFTVFLNDSHVMFRFGNTTLISRLIEEKYPNYESVIPKDNDKRMVINRNDMLASVRRVSLYSSLTTHQVRLSLKKNELKLSAEDIDFGGEAREVMMCQYDYEPLEIGFNAAYLVDVLSHIDTDEALFLFSESTRAALVQPGSQREQEEFLMLVMPVRLNP
ncbi:MAG: DNA polymerase III subunit beta [Bacteroidota bacterium]